MESLAGKFAKAGNDGTWILDFDGGGQIRIEREFTLVPASGEPRIVLRDPSTEVQSALTGQVESVNWTEAGALTVRYVTGLALEVPVDPDYEAWTVVDASGRLVVASPGGGVTTFPPRS